MIKNHILAAFIVTITGTAAAFPAVAVEQTPEPDLTGFYGGLSMRGYGNQSEGLQFGHLSSAYPAKRG